MALAVMKSLSIKDTVLVDPTTAVVTVASVGVVPIGFRIRLVLVILTVVVGIRLAEVIVELYEGFEGLFSFGQGEPIVVAFVVSTHASAFVSIKTGISVPASITFSVCSESNCSLLLVLS